MLPASVMHTFFVPEGVCLQDPPLYMYELAGHIAYKWLFCWICFTQGRLSDFSEVEEFPQPEATLCWENTVKQCNLAQLAHSV